MANYKNLCMKYMDEHGIKYLDHAENIIKVTYTGTNLRSITVVVFFSDNGSPDVSFKCWDICTFPEDKRINGIIVCNQLNTHYRWVQFSLDKDGDIAVSSDSYVDEYNCGAICCAFVQRTVNIVDEAYQTIMKALWS